MAYLTQLLDPSNQHPLATEYRRWEQQAIEYRTILDQAKIPQTFGKWSTFEEILKQDHTLEQDAFNHGIVALHVALLYLTDEGKRPLEIEDYIELQKRVIAQHPHSIWDNGLWFKRVNKEVRDYKLPCTAKVRDYLRQNENLSLAYSMAELESKQTGQDIIQILEQMDLLKPKEVTIITAKEKVTQTVQGKVTDDALQLYLIFTGKMAKENMN